jgi:hypothetical protein
MKTLAGSVGDLKRVMSNVRTRGTWGEVQLGAIIESLLTSEQYAKNVKTVPGSNDLVEFAVKMPGKSEETPVWIPIDSKYPIEHYQRLLDAHETMDKGVVQQAVNAFESSLRIGAKKISTKYVSRTRGFGGHACTAESDPMGDRFAASAKWNERVSYCACHGIGLPTNFARQIRGSLLRASRESRRPCADWPCREEPRTSETRPAESPFAVRPEWGWALSWLRRYLSVGSDGHFPPGIGEVWTMARSGSTR